MYKKTNDLLNLDDLLLARLPLGHSVGNQNLCLSLVRGTLDKVCTEAELGAIVPFSGVSRFLISRRSLLGRGV